MSNYEFWDELGKIFHAVVAYQEKSIEFNKRFINPWIRLGNVFDKQDRNTEAIAAYQQAVELEPGSAQNWFDLGNAYFRTEASQEAVEAYNKALELDPEMGWAYNNLALTLANQGSYTDAIPLYQRSIDLLQEDKDKAVAWNRLGNAYRKLNEYESALDAFQKADELDAENAGFRDQLDDVPDGPTLVEGENGDDASLDAASAEAAQPAVDQADDQAADQANVDQADPVSTPDLTPDALPDEAPTVPVDPTSSNESQSEGLNPAEEAATDISPLPEPADPDPTAEMVQDAAEVVAAQMDPATADPAAAESTDTAVEAGPETGIEASASVELKVAEVKEQTVTIIVQNIVETYTDSQSGTEAVTQTSDVEVTVAPVETQPADSAEPPAAPEDDLSAPAAEAELPIASPASEADADQEAVGADTSTAIGPDVPAEEEPVSGGDAAAEDETVEAALPAIDENVPSIHGAYEEFLKDNGDDLQIMVSESVEVIVEDPAPDASQEPVTKIDASGDVQIEVDTKNARVWNELGNVYFNTGSFDDALAAYSKAIELDRQFAWPYSNLALTYVQKGRFVEAILLYQRSIELFSTDPDKAVSWNRLGNVYRRLNDYENAIAAYQQADELDPDNTTLSMQSRFSLLGNYATDSKPSYAA